jgi:exodeoxyribonuclease V alpha subunit
VISSQLLRVTSVRSQNPRGFGGCIFAGKPLDEHGEVSAAGALLVVRADARVLGGAVVEPGQWWNVTGESSSRATELNGFVLNETQLEATEAHMAKPSGEHLIAFLAEQPSFAGIGYVKARRLWETFDSRLYSLLDSADVDVLSSLLTREVAERAVAAWAAVGDSRTLQWLQGEGMSVALGRKVLRFFGASTEEKLREDPYRLLSFCAGWREVDALARRHFSMAADDPRRLQAGIEEVCYRLFAAGHTSALSSVVTDHLQALFGPQTTSFPWRGLVSQALSSGLTNGSYVRGLHGIQPLGAHVMEHQVATAVAARLYSAGAALLDDDAVGAILAEYQRRESLTLNEQQIQAVALAARHRVGLVTGGAGVGKTTVLKAIHRLMDDAGIHVTQLALAGRAAKRMQEATGRPAATIASFLRTASRGALGEDCLVVIDEASMVDIISMSRVCEVLGEAPRLLLVGDPAQLMPVGPGLVLHALTRVREVPTVELEVVKRYGGAIAHSAASVRDGSWPELPEDAEAPIAFLPCDNADIPAMVLKLFEQARASTQILCARRSGPDGSKYLNALCQQAFTSQNTPVRVWSSEHDCLVLSGLRFGDSVLCTRNMWDRGLQNGSLGIVSEVVDAPSPTTADAGADGPVLAWIDWDDGTRKPLYESMLDDVELGYAITVHKAQGSQWKRVIVPVAATRMLDRTLLYTAVTRAQEQVLLIGDHAAAAGAVRAPPRAAARVVALDLILRSMLKGN